MRGKCLNLATLLLLITISSGEDKKEVPLEGPALRPYNVDPVSHKLIVDGLGGKVKVGGSVTLSASLPEGSINSCQWTSPDGIDYNPDIAGIDIDNEAIVSITDQKICNISISQLKETQLGDWKCRISHNASPQYQEAYLSVTKSGKSQTVRIPKHLRPEKYLVFLTPFIIIDNFTIQGHVDININVLEDGAKNVTLHSENIQIFENTVTIKDSNENDIAIEGFGYDASRQFFVIHTSEALTQGDVITLSIDFLAELNSGVAGFYRSSYFDEEKNATEYLATTQFQVADARQALPCFDEPAYKAVFQANLGRLKDMNSISNMPVEFESVPMSDNDVYVWDIYQETPLISTYLLAFIISRYTFKQGKITSNGVDFKFWSRKSVSKHTALSVEVAPKILEFYENNFNVSYPLPKLDMAAIPDFGAKGMENWGLITYLESFVIFKENESTIADKERVVHVTAHEIAHQWFGNLVTMEWWTDLWLNEGFAHYMQYFATRHALNNDSNIVDTFILSGVHSALERDSLTTSHAVSVDVNYPSDIAENFDSISYNKGAAIIRMMANFLGIEVFNRGIEHYLNKHKFGNAKQDDLWTALTEVGHESLDQAQSVKDIMDSWTLKMGYPVITVNRFDEEVPNQVTFIQERFLISEEASNPEEKNFRWWVPISYTTIERGFDETKNQVWMSPEEKSKTIILDETLEPSQPLIVNVQETGFYRVNYDVRNWEKISAALLRNNTAIHRVNRAQILDDSLTLAKAGLLDYPTALGTTEYLSQEFDYIPLKVAFAKFNYIGKMLAGSDGFSSFREFLLRQFLPLYERLGIEAQDSDSSLNSRLREEVIQIMCDLGHEDCEQQVAGLFSSGNNHRAHVALRVAPDENFRPVDLKYTVYCTSMAKGGEEEWNLLWKRYLKSLDATEKNTILSALACSKDVNIMQRLLDLTLNPDSTMKRQDLKTVIVGVSRTSSDLVWSWFRKNWKRIREFYEGGTSSHIGGSISNLIKAITENFNSESKLKELTEFYYDQIDDPESVRIAMESAIQKTRANINWMVKHSQQVVEWLQKKNEQNQITS